MTGSGAAVLAILFDFDGVLVDSEPFRFRAGAKALSEVGVALTKTRFDDVWLGRTDDAALSALLGGRFDALREQVVRRRNTLYESRIDAVPAFPDALRFIGRLSAGIRAAVVTGSRRVEVKRILDHLGLARRFDALVTAEDYEDAKPSPEPFLKAADSLGLSPEACLVLEDSPAGVAAALAAGMPVAAVDRGLGDASLADATWRVGSLDALSITGSGLVFAGASEERP